MHAKLLVFSKFEVALEISRELSWYFLDLNLEFELRGFTSWS